VFNSRKELIGKAARRFSVASVSRACVFHKACIMPNSPVRAECANLTDLNALRRDAKSRHVRPRGYAGNKVVTPVTPAAYFAAALVWRTL
jgi:hypothetical protein